MSHTEGKPKTKRVVKESVPYPEIDMFSYSAPRARQED